MCAGFATWLTLTRYIFSNFDCSFFLLGWPTMTGTLFKVFDIGHLSTYFQLVIYSGFKSRGSYALICFAAMY